MIRSDSLEKYVSLHAALVKEKAELEARLSRITAALGDAVEPKAVVAPVVPSVAAPVSPKASIRNAENAMTMREATLRVLAAGPLKRKEVLAGVVNVGYKFKAKSPMNSLQTVLYTCKDIKRADGKFFLRK